MKKSSRFGILLLCHFFLLSVSVAFADDDPPLPPQVEQELKEDKVEKEEDIKEFMVRPRYKVLLKSNSLELAPFVGPMLGEALPTAYFGGLRAQYHFNERFAIGADGGVSNTGVIPFPNDGSPANGDRDSYFADATIAYHFHAIILPVNQKFIQSDLFLVGGGGIFNTYGEIEPAVVIGGGTKIYFHRYAVLRIDVRNYLFHARVPPYFEREFSPNTMVMLGLSFFLPTRVSDFHVSTKEDS